MTAVLRSPRLVDAAFGLVLSAIGLLGLHDVFTGWTFLVVGLAGLALGTALAAVMVRLRQPLVVLVVVVVAAFFLFGGLIALHTLGQSYLLPMPRTLGQLADVSVHGWKQLVTTLPPIDNGALLTIPYLIGLLAGAATVLTGRAAWPGAPLLPPVAVLALVILLGVTEPSHAAVVGTVFTGVALGWVAVRSRRGRYTSVTAQKRRPGRRLVAAGLCVGVAACAGFAAPGLPGLAPKREVLRTHVVPPLNVEQYASPLVGFRRFTAGYKTTNPADELYDKPLFAVSGLPAGTSLRFAALDSYDGNVWGAGNVAGSAVPTAAGLDTFEKVGRVIHDPATGTKVAASVHVVDGAVLGVWVPSTGALTGIDFAGPSGCGAHVYYNLQSSTAVNTLGLAGCATYSFSAVLPATTFSGSTPLASGALPQVASATQFQQAALGIAGKSSNPAATLTSLAAYLRDNGHLTDGQGENGARFAGGHSLYRLEQFMSTAGQLAGDQEQFAAMLALLANDLNIPARVVVGVQSLRGGGTVVVKGSDVTAWVEVQAADGTWRAIPTSMFLPTKPPVPQNPRPQTNVPAANVPPPAPVHPPSSVGQQLDTPLPHRPVKDAHTNRLLHSVATVLLYVGVPIGILALLAGAIVGLKGLRRRRRRSRGSSVRQLAAGWHEVLDRARDFGHRAPVKATRREQARAIGLAEISESARWVDNAMFAAQPPGADVVAAYWGHVDQLCRQMARTHTRWKRIRAALNLATLRPGGLQRS